MSVLGWKAALVLVLSMIVWYAFASAFPSAPPDTADTMVIVGVMLGLVMGTSSLLKRFRNARSGAAAAGESKEGAA